MKRYLLILLTLLTLSTTTSCGLLKSLSANCDDLDQQYKDSLATQGKLYDSIPTNGAFSMAMVLSQHSVNEFFKEVSDLDLNVAGVQVSPPEIIVGMSPEELKKYHAESWPGPSEPIEARGKRFYVKLKAKKVDTKLFGTYSGEILFSFPIESKVIGTEKTEVWAKLKKAQLVYARLFNGGKSYTSNPIVVGTINNTLDKLPEQVLHDYKLFELKAWDIGQNHVKLIAGGAPDIDPINHTLTFGMFTNLIQSVLASVTWSEDFPQDADIGLHIHPELIRKMIARMMKEGEVPSTIKTHKTDAEGSTKTTTKSSALVSLPENEVAKQSLDEQPPQSPGNEAIKPTEVSSGTALGVTIQEMNADEYKSSEYFNLGFRLWRTGGGLCGYADIIAGLKMSIDENKFKFAVDPNTFRSVGGTGSGVIAGTTLNLLAQTEFFKQAVSIANVTVNFNEINITESKKHQPGKPTMEASHAKLSLDGNGVSVYLKLTN